MQATFDFDSFKDACSKGGEYTCTGNFAWIDPKFTTSPGVPILRSAVATLAATEYDAILESQSKANVPPLKATIAVNNATQDPLSKCGALKAVTPQEEVFAPYFMWGHRLKQGVVTVAEGRKWLKHFRSAVFTFKILPSVEAQEFETINIRQKAAHKYMAINFTPVQWVCKISQMKRDRETQGQKISNSELAKLFGKYNFKPARGQEEVTETYVENALYVWNRALCHTEVKTALINGAERYAQASMFDSLNKICLICRRCKVDDPTKIKWVFPLMLDRVQEGLAGIGDFSNACLFGKSHSKRGQLDLMLNLLEIKDHLLHTLVPSMLTSSDPMVAKGLLTNFADVLAYRKKVPEKDASGNRGASDLVWMANFTHAEKRLATFVENILYKGMYDEAIMKNMQQKQGATEVFQQAELQHEIDAIKEPLGSIASSA